MKQNVKEVGRDSLHGYPYVIAAFNTSWNGTDSRNWLTSIRSGLFGGVGASSPDVEWNYTLVVYADSEKHPGSTLTNAELFRRFMNDDGWYQRSNSGMRWISPLAPGFGKKARADVKDLIRKAFVRYMVPSGGAQVAPGSVRQALEKVAADCVDRLYSLLAGGVAPQYSRPLSPATLESRRSRGVPYDSPMYETGVLAEHIRWDVFGSERASGGSDSRKRPATGGMTESYLLRHVEGRDSDFAERHAVERFMARFDGTM